MKLGLIVNPVAGIGARLAWKGTDNILEAWKLIENGLTQPVWKITERALHSISEQCNIEWFIGGNILEKIDVEINAKIIGKLKSKSNRFDTQDLVKKLDKYHLDLLIFVGGDGTAIDIAEVNTTSPILGIPGGVKIFSPCFLHRPEDLGDFLKKWRGETTEVDLFDIDENEYKLGKAIPKLMGSTRIPFYSQIQVGKASILSEDDDDIYQSIAERILDDKLLRNKNILVGSGSTMKKIFKSIGINKTLLGICIIQNEQLYKTDCTYVDIEEFVENNRIDEIWVTPIGGQGHIFGRGNRQIPTHVIDEIGKEGIKIFSNKRKILNTPKLFTDTGNDLTDIKLVGYYNVIIGYYDSIQRKVEY